jgi:hypothetical protein
MSALCVDGLSLKFSVTQRKKDKFKATYAKNCARTPDNVKKRIQIKNTQVGIKTFFEKFPKECIDWAERTYIKPVAVNYTYRNIKNV